MKDNPGSTEPALAASGASAGVTFPIVFAISFAHLLNDTIQALVPALYPLLRQTLKLSYTQIGMITFVFHGVASVLQPVVGIYTDRRPMPYSLAFGMCLTLVGLISLAAAGSFPAILFSAAVVGTGSAVFHPEASRVAHMAAGTRRGLAQSLFQVGGNAGSALGPLLAALIIVPRGQGYVAWFSILAGIGMYILTRVGQWQRRQLLAGSRGKRALAASVPARSVAWPLAILLALIFSKYVYLVSFTSYYTLYLIERFGVSVQQSQLYLFAFLLAVAIGTIAGGPIGDRVGRKKVIWASIFGVAPFSLALPYAGLIGTAVLAAIIGLILASAFSAIVVYAQELMPGRVGLIAGLFFGVAFGVAGIGSVALGTIADRIGIIGVFAGCAFLPLIGALAVFLPDPRARKP
jgi:MFS transporter, FSR family, fosmidomycin resistance protein